MKWLIILTTLFFLSSGSTTISKNCPCFNGIGSVETDEPILRFNFSNGKSVSLCGYYDEDIQDGDLFMSEFNVFDCETGEALVEYGAMETCIIKTNTDLLEIQLTKYLPLGNNWEWQSVQIAEQLITSNKDNIEVMAISPKLMLPSIDENIQKAYLKDFKKRKGKGVDWEVDLGKLEVLSLMGNKKAWKLLKKYEAITGETMDGALAETWKDAIATVEWLGVE